MRIRFALPAGVLRDRGVVAALQVSSVCVLCVTGICSFFVGVVFELHPFSILSR